MRTPDEIAGLSAVLESPPPKLTVLRLVRSTAEVFHSIAERIPETVTTLEIVRPNLSALAELERRAPAIEHLELRLDVRGDRSMGAERVRRLKERLPRLRLGR